MMYQRARRNPEEASKLRSLKIGQIVWIVRVVNGKDIEWKISYITKITRKMLYTRHGNGHGAFRVNITNKPFTGTDARPFID